MSDPANTRDGAASSAEIEDVLSSIRRLVSEHNAAPRRRARPVADEPQPGTADLAPPNDTSPVEEEKLLLTPSQRVNDLDDPWAPVARPVEENDSEEALESSEDAGDGGSEEIVDGDPADDDADTAVDARPADKLYDWADTAGFNDTAQPEPATSYPSEAGYDDLTEDTSGDEPETVTAQEDDPFTPGAELFVADPGEAEWPVQDSDRPLRRGPAARVARMAGTSAAERMAGLTPASGGGEPTREERETSNAPEAISPVADADTSNDDMSDAADRAADAVDEASDLEPNTEPRDAQPTSSDDDDYDVEDFGDAPSPFTFPDSDESIIDEEVLREIIVDVLREELQGALGQRITRNVRKMVRREIRIALAMEDLE